MMKDAKMNKLNEPTESEDEDSKSMSETMSMATSGNQSNLHHHASITSLAVDRTARVDNMPRCSSLVSLIGNLNCFIK